MRSPYVLVVSLDVVAPSTVLFFGNLAGRVPFRIVQYRAHLAGELAGASAVVFVRGLFEFGNLIWCARRIGIPCYYFLDDNFVIVRDEVDIYGPICAPYSKEAMRTALRGFEGALVATESLRQYFLRERLHDNVAVYPPVGGPRRQAVPRDRDRGLTLAFFAGVQRRAPMAQYVYPAVQRLASGRKVTLIAPGMDERTLPPAGGVSTVYPPYERSYSAALEQMAGYGVDILLHPSFATDNNPFKNPHVLINADLLDAVPVFSNAPPYDAVADEGVAIVCENSADSWYDALTRLADDGRLRGEMRRRLGQYCAVHFGGDANAGLIDEMLRAHPSPDGATRMGRSVAGAMLLELGRARRAASRLTSRAAAPPQ